MEVKNIVCYSYSLNVGDPMAYLRIIGPLHQAGINIINGMEDGEPVIQRISEGDLILLQREFPNRFNEYLGIVDAAIRERKSIVFDLDDLLFLLPETHPDRQSQYYASSLLPMFQALRQADLVTVPTQKLRSVLSFYNDHIVVLPNYFDDVLWKLKQPDPKPNGEILTIGYMGGNSHKPDVEFVAPVLSELIDRYPNKVHLRFWGIQPPVELRLRNQVEWIPLPSYVYKEFAEFFQTQTADIFIAPLVDSLFNRCKSPLKFFEYSALGAPGVFSDLETYSTVVTHGQNGLLAKSLDDWRTCLVQLIENDGLRLNLVNSAQDSIRKDWLLSENALRWKDAFQNLSGDTLRKRSSREDLAESINVQLSETFLKKDSEIQAATANLAEKEQELQSQVQQMVERDQIIQGLNSQLKQAMDELEQTKSEIVMFKSSRSWRYTRPLRKLAHKVRGKL